MNTQTLGEEGRVFIDLQPVAKPRMTQRDKWEKRPIVERYWVYKGLVRAMLPEGYELPDEAEIVFAICMPKGWSKKKKQFMAREPHRQRPDIDNLLKALLDALYDDDSGIWSIKVTKIWAPARGGVLISRQAAGSPAAPATPLEQAAASVL